MAACSARPTIRRCGLCPGARAGQAGLWENLLTRFVRLREQATRLKSETWQAIDAEIKEHPAPKDSDSKEWMRNLSGTSEGRVDIHRVLAEDVLRHGLTARRDSAI